MSINYGEKLRFRHSMGCWKINLVMSKLNIGQRISTKVLLICKFWVHIRNLQARINLDFNLQCIYTIFSWVRSLLRPLLVGNLFQLHCPHQIWLPHEYCHYCHYCHYYIIIQSISYNIRKIITVFAIHTLTLSVMHHFDFFT